MLDLRALPLANPPSQLRSSPAVSPHRPLAQVVPSPLETSCAGSRDGGQSLRMPPAKHSNSHCRSGEFPKKCCRLTCPAAVAQATTGAAVQTRVVVHRLVPPVVWTRGHQHLSLSRIY